VLKQPQYAPVELEHQVVALFAATNGYADRVPVDRVRVWEEALLRSVEASHPEILKDVAARKLITPETETALRQAIESFNQGWQG